MSNPTNTTISGSIALNSSTSVKVADVNPDRIMLTFSNPNNQSVWLKLQAASIDDDKKGILVCGNTVFKMPFNTDNTGTYIGEVSAIADSGTPGVYVTEF